MKKPDRFDHAYKWQRGFCYLCGKKMTLKNTGGDQPQPLQQTATVDHVIPKGSGGRMGAENIALAHFVCNNRRAAQAPKPCAVMFAKAAHEAWVMDDGFRHAMWYALNISRVVDRAFHGVSVNGKRAPIEAASPEEK